MLVRSVFHIWLSLVYLPGYSEQPLPSVPIFDYWLALCPRNYRFIHSSLSNSFPSPSLSFSPFLSLFLLLSLAVFGFSIPLPLPVLHVLSVPLRPPVPFIHLSCNKERSLNSKPFLGSCEAGHLFQAGDLRTLSASVPPICFLLINRTAIPKGMHPLPFSRAEFIFHCMFLFNQKAF